LAAAPTGLCSTGIEQRGGGGSAGPAGIIEFIYLKSYRQQACSELAQVVVQPFDHDVGRLDKSGSGITLFEAQFPDGRRGDDCGDLGVSDCEDDLRQKPFDSDADDLSGKLISSTDAPIPLARLRVGPDGIPIKEWLEASERYAMVSSGRFGSFQSPGQYPVLDRGITYPQDAGGLAGCQHLLLVAHGLIF
jgi:hypothetical protein